MTMTRFGGSQPILWPFQPYINASVSTTLSMSASGHSAAAFGRVRFEGTGNKTLSRIAFMPGTLATATLTVDVQGMDTTNYPSRPNGTSIVGGAATISPTASTWFEMGSDFSTTPTVSNGQLIAVVWAFSAYTSGTFQVIGQNIGEVIHGPPNSALLTAAWAQASVQPSVCLKFSDGTYGSVGLNAPFTSYVQVTYDAADSPNEFGAKFTVPFGVRVVGVSVPMNLNNNGDDFVVKLYDTDGSTVLNSETQYGEWRGAGGTRRLIAGFSPVDLVSGSTYRITLLATDGTQTIQPYALDVDNTNLLAAHSGSGFFATERTGGAWTDTNTRVPIISLLISGVDIPSGSGMLVHPGMSGGMRG